MPAQEKTPVETRKMVTVVFADLADSTALGERLDAETLRQVMSLYLERMSSVVERHGGTVQKFIGDAIMAVFGIPTLHENDALRAATAAVEMRAALKELNQELNSRWGVRLEIRTGVNTGEIVTGDQTTDASFIVGDAINVAARLEQDAERGEILLGRNTYRLVHDSVKVQPTEPRQLKGKSEPVVAHQLLDIITEASPVVRRLDSALVGREPELRVLEEAFSRAERERGCRLLTILGPAGVGKSRLTQELTEHLDGRARTVRGRCLPYGEGITFWPIAEIVREVAGIREQDSPEQARERIRDLLLQRDDEAALVVDGVARALGLSVAAAEPGEIFWAIRKLIEAVAADHPLVVVLDDIHWAEPTFLDLIEYLTSFSAEESVLIVALARPELLEIRPNWIATASGADSLVLEPLGERDSEKLIENLLGEAALAEDVQRRITDVAQGNPLFVGEILRMLVDDGLVRRANSHWIPTEQIAALSVPPTIRALLAARLDRLEDQEREVLERAAVVGEGFWPGAVTALSPRATREQVWAQLQTLIRKELIQIGGSSFAGEDALTFSHILIRDTAYEAILKETRAELHELFATWLEQRAGDRLVEYEEILGYHLEQAYRYREALGKVDSDGCALARRAARYLAEAGKRAHARGDMQAAVKLLERSAALAPEEETERLALMLKLGHALFEIGEFAHAEAVLSDTEEGAAALGDKSIELRARLDRSYLRMWTTPQGSLEELREVAEQAIPALEEIADDAGLARGWRNLATVQFFECRFGSGAESLERALHHAENTSDQQLETEILPGLAVALSAGPVPVDRAIQRIETLLRQFGSEPGGEPAALASLGTRAAVEVWGLAGLEAMRGRFAAARALCSRAKSVFREVGQRRRLADAGFYSGLVEKMAGVAQDAERELRLSYDTLQEIGETAVLSTVAAELAEAIQLQGREREAEQLTEESERLAVEDDVESQVRWRIARAKLFAGRGDLEAGEALAREAVRRSSAVEFPNLQAGALVALAEIEAASGHSAEAEGIASKALNLYRAKGNLVSAATVEAFLAQLPGT